MSGGLQVIAQLREKNEELVLKTAKISEQELVEMRAEFEKRLGAAERKVGRGQGGICACQKIYRREAAHLAKAQRPIGCCTMYPLWSDLEALDTFPGHVLLCYHTCVINP